MPLSLSSLTPQFAPCQVPAATVEGLYVHVPFCFHKCHYCDFYSITRQSPERMEQFVARMLKEADQWTDAPCSIRPQTIFFGGGTPSLLPIDLMHQLIQGLCNRLDCSAVNEWTVEVNPATANQDYFHMLKQAGVNRISLGAQSFEQTELATLERHHDPADVPRSLEMARAAGIDNLNIDLIYAIPGQDLASWKKSLEHTIALDTPHLSAYGLTYETNTPIAVKKRLGRLIAAEESLELEMMHYARQRLSAADLQPYEISNFAQPGQECHHNLMYWKGGNYIGLGPSAASHVSGHRWRNRPHLGEWEEHIDRRQLPAVDIEILSPLQRCGELAMLMLRLDDGLNFNDFTARTGEDARSLYVDQISRLTKLGLIEIDQSRIRLSHKGLNVADGVAAEFVSTT